MNICLEGPRGNWDWFEVDIHEDNLGLDFDKIEKVCGTSNPAVIDIEYTDEPDLEDILSYDGMGWTSIHSLIEQAKKFKDYDDWDLERIAIYMRTKSGDLDDALNNYENHFYIQTDDSDPESLALELVSEDGIDEDMAVRYFDYEALGRDLRLEGTYEYDEDEDDETIGEEYIDSVYGGIDEYIQLVGVDGAEGYFDFDAYGRTLKTGGWAYDDVSGRWISERYNKKRSNKLTIKESASKKDITLVMNRAARVNDYDELDSVLSSLLSIDKKLYQKYSEIYRTQHVSAAYIGSEISDELYYMLQEI